MHKKATKKLQPWHSPLDKWDHLGAITIDTFSIDPSEEQMVFEFSTPLSYVPVREETKELLLGSLRESLGRKFRNYKIKIGTDGQSLETLIPNYFRKTTGIDPTRLSPEPAERTPIVRRLDSTVPDRGLYGRNIALWHSHGWYYEAKLDRWEWQRARLYGTVEDIFPMTFTLPYLTPMLENAGANVFLPRERDTQVHEVIVDNDGSSGGSEINMEGISIDTVMNLGFLKKDTLFNGENPFRLGSHLKFEASEPGDGFLEYLPDIPESGWYAVYISYQQSSENVSDAQYSVTHTGGTSRFLVNQKIGGGTFIYMGLFHFENGKNPEKGSVRIFAESSEKGWITADAVKIGGGMGNVARKPSEQLVPNKWSLAGAQKNGNTHSGSADPSQFQWKVSGKPRYQEGARYYLQYIGVPDSLVYSLHAEKNDYNDDYQSRGEWVNYLIGAPNGPNLDRSSKGLNIPIDLSLAFHTDAGITPKDSTIGTLAIYSSVRDEGKFPSGQSKLASRDLSDIIQSEIVNDIRKQFKSGWSRRGLWNKEYSEAWRPNAPSMLLELLSHQNLSDMAYGHDPLFKFAVSRAIYKGITKFLAFQNNSDYVIQPLPVNHMSMKQTGEKKIQLSWKPVLDSLEDSAIPTGYKVYQRIDEAGFDNGRVVSGTSVEIELAEFGTVYSFKVTALNQGGESFPSEVLSTCLLENDKPAVLVVNAFDRVSGPAMVDEGEFAGFAHWDDEGVADKLNIGYIGKQYDFDRKSPWLDDDSPGWGASYGDMEGNLIPGNSFDNTILHGKSINDAGYSFISSSDEAFCDPVFNADTYRTVDIIFGEEKTTKSLSGKLFKVFDEALQSKVREFIGKGGNVFASGAYLGSDHIINSDTIAQKFANEILHFKRRTNHAVREGTIYSTDYASGLFDGTWHFNTTFHPTIYKVEAPDALEPYGEDAITTFRYLENNSSAGIAFSGKYKTVVLGFPFETIIDKKDRDELMEQILSFFDKSK